MSIFTLDIDFICYSHDTQLFLNSEAFNFTYQSSGVLEIYSIVSARVVNLRGGGIYMALNLTRMLLTQLANSWATLVLSHTLHLPVVYSRDADIWLDGVTYGDYAYSCLDNCFCYPQSLTAVQCDPGNVIALTCTFNLIKRNTTYPGSRWLCEEVKKQTNFCAPDTPGPESKKKSHHR